MQDLLAVYNTNAEHEVGWILVFVFKTHVRGHELNVSFNILQLIHAL